MKAKLYNCFPRKSCSRPLLFENPRDFVLTILLNLTLKILPLHQIRNIVIVLLLALPALTTALLLLQALIALCEFPQASEAVRAQLVQDPGDQLGEFFVFARAVDREGVGRDRCVDCEAVLAGRLEFMGVEAVDT